jgi:hypothetical protein
MKFKSGLSSIYNFNVLGNGLCRGEKSVRADCATQRKTKWSINRSKVQYEN